ncbi:MAG: 1-deoxy-D-xylulose-5-phosphate synthase [Bacillota bacterium]
MTDSGTILSTISSPEDLKNLNLEDLRELAKEIRGYLIKSVSETGGHLAPNLGVVELTLALHRVLDSPRDRIVWDVGHQSYTHKIICGRLGDFCTLRQPGGMSGFPKLSESPHDVFETGHSSTSIAAALGMAIARDIRGEEGEVVAVIGDGALTAGLAYEGLNNAGALGIKLIVVLNDNSMSISPNVGAMSGYLARLRSDPTYNRLKEDVNSLVDRLPNLGKSVAGSVRRVKGSLKYLLLPGMIFEELGFTYLGPVDGHDLAATMEILDRARRIPGPVLVHANTVKGKGYAPAEERPDKFHGIGSFDPKTGNGKKSSSTPSYTEVFSDALIRLAEEDDRIVAITAAMPDGTGTDSMAERFPERFFDVGIAEPGAVTFAAGLASKGMRPIVAIYSTFLQRGYDGVVHDVANQGLPVVFGIDRAGIVGADGDTHQGAFDVAYLRHVPGMVLASPRDEAELGDLLYSAVNWNCPAAVRYPRGAGPGARFGGEFTFIEPGRGELLREGTDAAIVAFGHPVTAAHKAAEAMAKEGVEIAVANARFAKPLDSDLILSLAREVPVLITVEEGCSAGGFGSAVLELLHRELPCSVIPEVVILGFPDRFIPHGDQESQRSELGLDADGILKVLRDHVTDRSSHTAN